MKSEMRRALAQLSFEEKIRKVSELIQLSVRVKATQRIPSRKRGVSSTNRRRAVRPDY